MTRLGRAWLAARCNTRWAVSNTYAWLRTPTGPPPTRGDLILWLAAWGTVLIPGVNRMLSREPFLAVAAACCTVAAVAFITGFIRRARGR